VGVGVDQAGQQRTAGAVDDRGAGRDGQAGADRGDDGPVEQDIVPRLEFGAVECAGLFGTSQVYGLPRVSPNAPAVAPPGHCHGRCRAVAQYAEFTLSIEP
jgi:hypothetical protein